MHWKVLSSQGRQGPCVCVCLWGGGGGRLCECSCGWGMRTLLVRGVTGAASYVEQPQLASLRHCCHHTPVADILRTAHNGA